MKDIADFGQHNYRPILVDGQEIEKSERSKK